MLMCCVCIGQKQSRDNHLNQIIMTIVERVIVVLIVLITVIKPNQQKPFSTATWRLNIGNNISTVKIVVKLYPIIIIFDINNIIIIIMAIVIITPLLCSA